MNSRTRRTEIAATDGLQPATVGAKRTALGIAKGICIKVDWESAPCCVTWEQPRMR